MIRVFLADDHPVVRRGVEEYIATVDGMTVVGTAASCTELLQRIRETGADVLVLDLQMPGAEGAETVGVLSQHGVRTVVFSLYAERALQGTLLDAGAAATVSKHRDLDVLIDAIRAAHSGVATENRTPPLPKLSKRERQVLDGIAAGHPLKNIAIDLSLSSSTVHTYARRLRAKLGCETIPDIVRFAERAGLVTDPDPP